jgi:tryptophan-rich sensory protein
MDFMTWYESLAKPGWTPDPATIGLIWVSIATALQLSITWMNR